MESDPRTKTVLILKHAHSTRDQTFPLKKKTKKQTLKYHIAIVYTLRYYKATTDATVHFHSFCCAVLRTNDRDMSIRAHSKIYRYTLVQILFFHQFFSRICNSVFNVYYNSSSVQCSYVFMENKI